MSDIITNDAEWHAARLQGIGASEASAIVGCNPYMSNIDLWQIKTGRKQAPDISNNANVAYGHAAEGPLRELFALDYPELEVICLGPYDMVRNPEYPWLFATLDGRLVERATGRRGIYEGKTAEILRGMQKEKWWNNGKPRLPDNYYVQVLHQFLATGWDFAYLHAQLKRVYDGIPVSTRRPYPLERHEVQNDLDYLLEEEIKFWGYVQRDEMPPLILPEI